MKRLIFAILMSFTICINGNSSRIFDYETYVGCADLMYSWNDQVIITEGYMQRSDLLPYMVAGHEYMVRVTYGYGGGLTSVYSFYAQYTCNMDETDEEGNIINADYGTLSDGAYTGFFNIATDVPDDVQEEMLGTDYDEDYGQLNPYYICMHATFGFHFEIDDSSINSIRIEVFD